MFGVLIPPGWHANPLTGQGAPRFAPTKHSSRVPGKQSQTAKASQRESHAPRASQRQSHTARGRQRHLQYRRLEPKPTTKVMRRPVDYPLEESARNPSGLYAYPGPSEYSRKSRSSNPGLDVFSARYSSQQPWGPRPYTTESVRTHRTNDASEF